MKRQLGEADLIDLVARARDGDQAAWNQIVDGLENLVWSVVRGFRMNDADALDAAQLTWLRAVENLDRVQDPARLGLWLATTARRECMRIVERGKRTAPADPHDQLAALIEPADDFAGQVVERSEGERILDALNEMDASCQQLLRLVLCDPPCSYSEIAEIIGISVGTIGPRRQRCLSRLRAAI